MASICAHWSKVRLYFYRGDYTCNGYLNPVLIAFSRFDWYCNSRKSEKQLYLLMSRII